MITVVIIGVLAVGFAYLAGRSQQKLFLKVSFAIIYVFLALRYDYGNDYNSYLEEFVALNTGNLRSLFDGSSHFEAGWIFLCYLFRPMGFFALVAVVSLFNCFVCYRFINKYVPASYYWFGVARYIYYPPLMLMSASAIRQSIAVSLFMLSIDYLCKRQILRYIFIIMIASLFHSSALVLIPVCFLSVVRRAITNAAAIVLLIAMVLLYIYGNALLPNLQGIIANVSERYNVYTDDVGEQRSALGTVANLGFFALYLYYARSKASEVGLLFKVAVASCFIFPVSLVISMIGRYDMYFAVITITIIPVIVSSIRNKIHRRLILAVVLAATVYRLVAFFGSDIWAPSYGHYTTIFSSDAIY